MLIVPLLLMIAVAYRLRHWDHPRTRPLTIALSALACAITLRIPSVGDDTIDTTAHELTGLANVSEWITESLVIVAAASFLAWVINACGIARATRWSIAYWGASTATLSVSYLASNASRTQTKNLTALPGAQPYWMLFSVVLGASMVIVVYAAIQACRAAITPRRRLSYQLLVGAGTFGLAYCLHKIVYLMTSSRLPGYMGTAWTLVGISLVLFALASITATTTTASNNHSEPALRQ